MEMEGYNPRELLPTEIWASVFEYLKAPKDWLNCFYASKVFRIEAWLKWQSSRTIRLFPEVLKIYCEFEHSQSEHDDSDEESESESESYSRDNVFTKIHQITKLEFLKTCRLVCKDWKNHVDSLLQNPFMSPSSVHTRIDINLKKYQTFRALLEHGLKDNISSKWNPFPNGELTITDEDEGFDLTLMEPDDEFPATQYIFSFQKDIEEYLKKFGHHVKVFSHYGKQQQQYSCQTHWYNTIVNWINYFSNLETLALIYINICDFDESLMGAVELHPFPKLKSLKTLHVQDTPMQVLTSIVKSNKQLEKIIINRFSYRLVSQFGYISLRNLTTLYITVVTMDEIRHFEYFSSPLKTLKLQIFPSFFEQYNISQCFKVLECFRDTLTYLHFSLPSFSSGKKERPLSLKLPLLKELTLRHVIGRDNLYQDHTNIDAESEVEYDESTELLHLLSPLSSLEKVTICPLNINTDMIFKNLEAMESSNLDEYVGEWLVTPLWNQLQGLKVVELVQVSTTFSSLPSSPTSTCNLPYFRPRAEVL